MKKKKNPEEIVRSTYSGTALEVEQLRAWARQNGMGISAFIHEAARHYVESKGDMDKPSDQSLEPITEKLDLIIKKQDQLLSSEKHPRQAEQGEASANLENQIARIERQIDLIRQSLEREWPVRNPDLYSHLEPRMMNLPAMEVVFILLDMILEDLRVTPKGDAIRLSVINRLKR